MLRLVCHSRLPRSHATRAVATTDEEEAEGWWAVGSGVLDLRTARMRLLPGADGTDSSSDPSCFPFGEPVLV